MTNILALGVTFFKRVQVRLGHLAIVVQREDQRNIDVDALTQRLPDRWNALRRAGILITKFGRSTVFQKRRTSAMVLGIVRQIG